MGKLGNALTNQDINSLVVHVETIAQQPNDCKETESALNTISDALTQLTNVQERKIHEQKVHAQSAEVSNEQIINILNAVARTKSDGSSEHIEHNTIASQGKVEVQQQEHKEDIESLLPKQPLP
ncbi:hypothetical protein HG263_03655 [Pseudoalteromonas sp. JBTF-M23]|uniref:Uncharacterized protein n=1 Tax=Pseudoalteromonas caenipelagi TaxID=2726988 RepID=A0A849V9S5_9GAMM|nr:hypothetical protein [Pseudoalteromonas caenipelagi]NOU49638.1 hypothetical protein [Pseudoalteromonas caenipelagi]